MPPRSQRKSDIWSRPTLVRAIAREQRRLGQLLESCRRDLGWTQEGAAERVGVHEKTLGRMERGEVNVTLATLVAVARAYKVGLSTLFDSSP